MEPGSIVVRREVLNDGRCWLEVPVRVVRDDDELLATYMFSGAPFTFPPGDWPIAGGAHPWAGRVCWTGNGVLMLQRPGEAYAVWVFWHGPERRFDGWYVNFQEPFRRTERGYDTQDLELDIVTSLEGSWRLKDDDLLDVRVDEGRFTPDQAKAVRAHATEVGALLDAGAQWWDASWRDWRPPPGWDLG